MLYPGDFKLILQGGTFSPADARVLARVGLNALFDPARYPVDLSELRNLGIEARLAARAFVAYMSNNPDEYASWSTERCDVFLRILSSAQLEGAVEP